MSFSTDMTKIAARLQSNIEEAARGTIIELFRAVIQDTPVDTGRLAGNWQTTVSTPAAGEVNRDKGAAEAEATLTVKKPGVYWLTNNLPYAQRIEFDGHSSVKAPQGMVRINLRRITAILNREAAKAKR